MFLGWKADVISHVSDMVSCFQLTWPCSLPSSPYDRSHPFPENGLSSEENNHTVRGHSVIHLLEEKHNIRAQVLN